MIYLDSPSGVGYSYSDTPSDYNTGDNQTAVDSTRFLEQFFQLYPEFAGNTFWITGESYAGVYITTLAYNVLFNSTATQLQANLRKGGLMLGNPVTGSCFSFHCCIDEQFNGADDVLDYSTALSNYYFHAMVSPRVYSDWISNQCDTATPPHLKVCADLWIKAYRDTGGFDQPLAAVSADALAAARPAINRDCLYYSFCVGNATLEFMEDTAVDCYSVDQQIAAYLNYPSVQSAFHAKPTKWVACGGVNYTRTVTNVLPYLEAFFAMPSPMRILYYSGDIDVSYFLSPFVFSFILSLVSSLFFVSFFGEDCNGSFPSDLPLSRILEPSCRQGLASLGLQRRDRWLRRGLRHLHPGHSQGRWPRSPCLPARRRLQHVQGLPQQPALPPTLTLSSLQIIRYKSFAINQSFR